MTIKEFMKEWAKLAADSKKLAEEFEKKQYEAMQLKLDLRIK